SGRRRGSPGRPAVPAAGGPGAVRRPAGRPRRPGGVAGPAAAGALRGGAGRGAAGRGRTPARRAAGLGPPGDRRLHRRWPGGGGGPAPGRLERAADPPPAPPARRAGRPRRARKATDHRREPTVTPTIEQAYQVCEEITRTRARNFYYGIRLLPPPKR